MYGRCMALFAIRISIQKRMSFDSGFGRTNPTTWLVIRESFDDILAEELLYFAFRPVGEVECYSALFLYDRFDCGVYHQ